MWLFGAFRSSALICAAGLCLGDSVIAQTNFPQVMPAETLYGNTNPASGPGFAVPLAQLAASISLLSPATVSFTANAVALATASIPSTVSLISTTTAGCSLNYAKGGPSPGSQYGSVLNAGGVYWEPIFDNSPVRACQFGAVGDGSFNAQTNAIAGTDNTTAIQNALDYAMRNKFDTVCLNSGGYKTSDTLQMGWGDALYALTLQPCGSGRAAYAGGFTAGVAIFSTKTDRCVVNIQAGRQNAIRSIGFAGQNYVWGSTRGLVANLPFSSTDSGWMDPALVPTGSNPGGLDQHAPYAAICYDAYSGASPAHPYPNLTFPSWTGLSSQYNKGVSSDLEITNVEIDGFPVGINLTSNGDGNGDFVKIDKLSCEFSVYCVSVGNTQSRSIQASNINASLNYTILTNNTFGQGLGNGIFGGMIFNVSESQGYQLFKLSPSLGQPIDIRDTHGEAMVRFGQFGPVSSFGQSINIDGCSVSFDYNVTRSVASALFEMTPNSGNMGLTLRNCNFVNTARILPLVHGSLSSTSLVLDGGAWEGAVTLGPLFNSAALQQAVNFTGSIFLGTVAPFPPSNYGRVLTLNPVSAGTMSGTGTTTDGSGPMGSNLYLSSVRNSLTQLVTGMVDQLHFQQWNFSNAAAANGIVLTSGTYTSVSPSYSTCDTASFTYLATYQTNAGNIQSKLYLGDLLYVQNTGALFVVTAIGGADGSGNFPITILQQNQMTVGATGLCVANLISDATLAGTTQIIHSGSGISFPQVVYYGDFAAGSTSVTNIHRGDGFAGNLAAFYVSGDLLGSLASLDTASSWPITQGTKISSVTAGSPGSMVLDTAAQSSGRFPILPFQVTNHVGIQTNGIAAKPTPSAAGGSCAAAGAQTGNQVRGTVALSGSCVATNTVTLTFLIHAPTGWFCTLNDRTAPTILFPQTSASATTAVFTAQGTSGAADVLGFECAPY